MASSRGVGLQQSASHVATLGEAQATTRYHKDREVVLAGQPLFLFVIHFQEIV